ncbi:MAG: peptidase T [Clostridiales bacterium]|nr:peptidase T [Clostridiales bacterium]
MSGHVTERFLRYVAVDTQSKEDQEAFPSTEKQKNLARMLCAELEAMGAVNARVDEYGYVYAEIPTNMEIKGLSLGFIAHMDTSSAASGADIHPLVVKNYDSGDILLNPQSGQMLRPADYPELSNYIGQDLITTDGTTLLGADDKAGVAEIMTMAEYLLSHPEILHGKICIAFTPDEEVGRGVDFFDVDGFGADVAYTVDGGALGELEYECFNAAGAKITIHGVSIHPGSARGIMKNALLIGMELHAMLPAFQNPACTDGYEGFFHLDHVEGDVEESVMHYIIRDHDREKFEQKKELMEAAAAYLNQKYGEQTVGLDMQDSYYNMREKIEEHPYLIEHAVQSMERIGITPKICAIRGGTDGARLSFLGLPCPNLCTGGHNYHGRYEYVCIQSMEKVTELLVEIARTLNGKEG